MKVRFEIEVDVNVQALDVHQDRNEAVGPKAAVPPRTDSAIYGVDRWEWADLVAAMTRGMLHSAAIVDFTDLSSDEFDAKKAVERASRIRKDREIEWMTGGAS